MESPLIGERVCPFPFRGAAVLHICGIISFGVAMEGNFCNSVEVLVSLCIAR